MFRSVIRFAGVFLLLLTGASWGASQPTDIRWGTLETTHFFIHYNLKNESTARRLAAMVEPIHTELVRDIRWAPEDKTNVVLIDSLDLTNGSAIPIPYNTIELYITPPPPSSVLGDYDDWLRLVFTHEYTHILHLDQAAGASKITRDLLGRSFIPIVGPVPVPFLPFPNILVPPWMIEGYATLDETRHTTAGRGDSSYAAMVLRMAALDDAFFPLDKGSGQEGEWPGGAFRYLYGEAFLDYLVTKFGVEKVNAMFHKHSHGLTPFLIEIPAFLSLKSTLQEEWSAWRQEVLQDGTRLRKSLAKHELTDPELLTHDGWETRHPRLSPDRQTLYHTVTNNYSFPHVNAIDLKTGETRELFERNSNLGPVAPSRDGRYLYFTQLETFRKFYLIGDAYRYDLKTGDTQRLTRGERLLYLDVSPDGKRVVAVKNDLQRQALILYRVVDSRLVLEKVLVRETGRVFDIPRFSPAGDQITYAAWSPGGFADIYVTDLQGHEIRMTQDRYVDSAARFNPEGTRIVFSSDRTGIYNLFSLPVAANASTDRPRQLTNVIGGLFESDSLDENTVVAAAYNGDGFNVAKTTVNHPADQQIQWRRDREAYQSAYAESFTGVSRPYAPGATLWPRYWFPILNLTLSPGGRPMAGFVEAGLQTGGRDVLGKHDYELQAFYNRSLHRPGAVINYTYDGFTPTLSFGAEDVPLEGALRATQAEDELETPGVRTQSVAFTIQYPFPHYRSSQDIMLAYVFNRDIEFGDLRHDGGPVSRRRGMGILRWSYNSSRLYGITLGPQDGTLLGLTNRIISHGLGASYDEALLLGDARHYWRLPYRQVISAQAQGGLANRSEFAGPFFLGGANPRTGLGDVGILPLRGFDLGAQEGNKLVKGSLEYRFPLGLIKRGIPFWGTFPLLADQLHGAVFVDAGSAFRERPDILASTGAELKFDFTVGYFIPFTLGLGVAVPVVAGGEPDGPTLYSVLQAVSF